MESSEEVVVDTVEMIEEKVAEVAEAAEEFVEEMTGIVESADKSGDAIPTENTAEPAPRMTMEERKAKLAELRKKMVRLYKANGFKSCVDSEYIGRIFKSEQSISCG